MDDSIKQESLGELVANEIRKSIWSRELEFGQRLIENDLSEKFDVSRSTIRDALKILEYEEMVISKPRKGTYISQFSNKDWREIIELRTIVEAYAFVKALPNLKSKQFKELEAILDEMRIHTINENWRRLFDLDMKFHSYMVNLSRNSRVIRIYESIQVQIRTFLVNLDKYYSNPYSFYEEQKELFETLLTKDPSLIEKKIRIHIEYVEGKLLADDEDSSG
ncbi:GntR family transcriptional regulator [Bacillus sp. JJ1566]|uniref:GntR family transcriptional regulator n=1 Tax=Bacillus sp. JJ1566 TaxID=3122961 RepID=UPI002FFF0EAD